MDVINQVLFLIILASSTNGMLEKADLQKIASQLKVTHYDCGEMTENNLYALNQVSQCNIAPENLEVRRAKITNYTKTISTRQQRNSCRVKYHSEQWHNFVQFYPHCLDSAAGNHASIMFALFPGDYDGLLKWPFSKTIHLSVRDQLDPQNTWTITFAPSERISFRRPTREPLPTLMNFNFFPHCKMFSKIENFLLDNTLYLEKKFTDLPDPEGATPFSFNP